MTISIVGVSIAIDASLNIVVVGAISISIAGGEQMILMPPSVSATL